MPHSPALGGSVSWRAPLSAPHAEHRRPSLAVGFVSVRVAADTPFWGPYLAVAIITTFYGAVMCYLYFQPLASRLDVMSKNEVLMRSIILMSAPIPAAMFVSASVNTIASSVV